MAGRIWGTSQLVAGHASPIELAEFSPDGRSALTIATNHTAYLWNAKAAGRFVQLQNSGDGLTRVTFSPDSLLISGWASLDQLQIWDTASGKALASRNFRPCILCDILSAAWASGVAAH